MQSINKYAVDLVVALLVCAADLPVMPQPLDSRHERRQNTWRHTTNC
jgi:hypothetical protein